MFKGCQIITKNARNFSRYVNKDSSGRSIRKKFLDYFINENNHNFVRSSPVVPFCDPSVAFVNAGMNQFKGVFTGTQQPQYRKVANSQKCVRVGGKHNDLAVVGSDGYHHTFFEMLGSWSFGDYFKKEACELAWKLLTEEYKIHPSRLYVTYFKGDPDLEIGEDVETKEIWKLIGISEDRILPFASKDNFWEMGPTGPCGPCTEIHVDHLTTTNRANLVNKGLHDLTELWNIVFIQYNRQNSNSLASLPEQHVDTGMGFERLTSLLQGKISNYDTDNFTYLLKAIHKNCSEFPEYQGKFGENDWNDLDASYRILSDHARMITVCLADAMIPEQNQKLRRIMRRSFLICENVFKKKKGLLRELSNYVIEHLGPIYTEMERNVKQIQQIIDYEEEVYEAVRNSANEEWRKLVGDQSTLLGLDINETPSLVAGYREIKAANPKMIDAKLAFRLYDSFGLDEEAISDLAKAFKLTFDAEGLRKELEVAKIRSKEQNVLSVGDTYEKFERAKIPKTDRSDLYSYNKDGDDYDFKKLPVNILKIVHNCDIVSDIKPEVFCSLLLDRSNLYTEAGGQISDKGAITFRDGVFEIAETENLDGYVLHKGFLHSGGCLKEGQSGILEIDSEFRLKIMRNHTAIHLLNSSLRCVKGATCQKSSKVTQDYFNVDVGIFSEKLTINDVGNIETTIGNLIQEQLPVKITEINSQQLSNLNEITLIPGEIYPECGIRIVEITKDEFVSREPCCGTHVLNTGDLGDFCIISVKSLGRGTASIHGVTGDKARTAKAEGVEIINNLESLKKRVIDGAGEKEDLNSSISHFKQKLNYNVEDSNVLPFLVKQQCLELLEKVSKKLRESEKRSSKELVEYEMRKALMSNTSKTKTDQTYLVHCIRLAENVPLQRATKCCPDIPVLVISYCDNVVKARCCIPESLRNENFNAEKWMTETVASIFDSGLVPPKGYDPTRVCNMKSKRVRKDDWDSLLRRALDAAKNFVEQHS